MDRAQDHGDRRNVSKSKPVTLESRGAPSVVVYAPGSTVMIAEGRVEAKILQVAIGLDEVRYQVSWWDGRDRKEVWIQVHEITRPSDCFQNLKIGFLPYDEVSA